MDEWRSTSEPLRSFEAHDLDRLPGRVHDVEEAVIDRAIGAVDHIEMKLRFLGLLIIRGGDVGPFPEFDLRTLGIFRVFVDLFDGEHAVSFFLVSVAAEATMMVTRRDHAVQKILTMAQMTSTPVGMQASSMQKPRRISPTGLRVNKG